MGPRHAALFCWLHHAGGNQDHRAFAPGGGLVVAGGALDVGRVALGLKPGPAHRLLRCPVRVLGVAVTLLRVHSCYSLPSLVFDKAGLLIQRCQGQLVHKFKFCIKFG